MHIFIPWWFLWLSLGFILGILVAGALFSIADVDDYENDEFTSPRTINRYGKTYVAQEEK